MSKSKSGKKSKGWFGRKDRSDEAPVSDQERFGAVAFVENRDVDENGEDAGQPLSLDSLREAFVALEDEEKRLTENEPRLFPETGEDFAPEVPEYDEAELVVFGGESPDEDAEDSEPETTGHDDGEAVEISPKSIVEAMLFVGDRENRPLSPILAAERMRNVAPEEVAAVVDELNRDYRELGCPYWIREEDDGYRMVLRPEFEPVLNKFYGKIRDARLSQQAIDTLAVVAYRQPVTAEEVQAIRKQPSSALLSQLVRRGLLGVEREMRDKKKILLYRTTDRFLELFQLESLDDLPVSEDLDFS